MINVQDFVSNFVSVIKKYQWTKKLSNLPIRPGSIGLDKNGYQVNSFLISPRKRMLWVLIRSTSVRCF